MPIQPYAACLVYQLRPPPMAVRVRT